MSKVYRVSLEFASEEEAMRFFERASQRPELLGAYPTRIKQDTIESHFEYTPINPPLPAVKTVFISYRHADSADITHRIYDYLVAAFGNKLFIDLKITLGKDFKQVLDEKLIECDVMLVVMGPAWDNTEHTTRLHQYDDIVRQEIETALQRDIQVIPLLVAQRLNLPVKTSLPDSLHPLIDRNGMWIRSGADFENDIRKLITQIIRG